MKSYKRSARKTHLRFALAPISHAPAVTPPTPCTGCGGVVEESPILSNLCYDCYRKLVQSPWTTYAPSEIELSRRSYKDRHVYGHACPRCGLTLTVNETAHKTTSPDRPFYTRRLSCPGFFRTGCQYTEPWTVEILRELNAALPIEVEVDF